jgi:hypothetical protein
MSPSIVRFWFSVSISSSGKYQTAVVNSAVTGYIWISSNYGLNGSWIEKSGGSGGLPSTAQNWTSVSVSSSGQYQVAAISGGNIWISSDYGATWSVSTAPSENWPGNGLSISASGAMITGVVYNGNIWTYSTAAVFVPGRMAIGKTTISATYTLDVNGVVNVSGTRTSVSDYRIKDNVRQITNTIDELRPLSYFNRLSGKEEMGIIAHELQEHFPFLVNGEKDGKDYQSVNYTGLIGLLVKEFQEIKAATKDLEDRMTNIEIKK